MPSNLTIRAQPKVIRKTTDETVNNNAAVQDDNALLFAVGANENWHFKLLARYDSSAVADFRYTFTGPAGSTVGFLKDVSQVDGSTEVAGGTDIAADGSGVGTIRHLLISGFIANGGTAGNLTFRWAQVTAEVSDTKVRANSYLLAWKG